MSLTIVTACEVSKDVKLKTCGSARRLGRAHIEACDPCRRLFRHIVACYESMKSSVKDLTNDEMKFEIHEFNSGRDHESLLVIMERARIRIKNFEEGFWLMDANGSFKDYEKSLAMMHDVARHAKTLIAMRAKAPNEVTVDAVDTIPNLMNEINDLSEQIGPIMAKLLDVSSRYRALMSEQRDDNFNSKDSERFVRNSNGVASR